MLPLLGLTGLICFVTRIGLIIVKCPVSLVGIVDLVDHIHLISHKSLICFSLSGLIDIASHTGLNGLKGLSGTNSLNNHNGLVDPTGLNGLIGLVGRCIIGIILKGLIDLVGHCIIGLINLLALLNHLLISLISVINFGLIGSSASCLFGSLASWPCQPCWRTDSLAIL